MKKQSVSRPVTLALCSLVSFIAGCASNESRVRARAATDFGCPEKDVQVSASTAEAFRAQGCGKDSMYACYESTLSGMVCERTLGPVRGAPVK
jgi:hypothetical protein